MNVCTKVIETEWAIDFHGWIIKVMAANFRQAKYRAWKKWNEGPYSDVSFRDFVYEARQW
jgi:hypothetical protein